MFKLKKIPTAENETCKNCHFDNFCGRVGASKIHDLDDIWFDLVYGGLYALTLENIENLGVSRIKRLHDRMIKQKEKEEEIAEKLRNNS